jgi:hypothetical protein
MIRYYQLVLKNDIIGYCHVVGDSNIVMTLMQVIDFKQANEPHSFRNYYYDYEIVPIIDMNNYKIQGL